MWTTLAILTALGFAPQQNGELRLANPQLRHWFTGAPRKSTTFHHLDVIIFSFDIEGLKGGDDGKVKYSIGMELKKQNGRLVVRQEPKEQTAYNLFGGNSHPAFVYSFVGGDTEPGQYTLTAIVRDPASKAEKTQTLDFEVLKPEFAMVQIGMSYDPNGKFPAPPRGVLGQQMFVYFSVTNFKVDEKTKKPHITASFRVLENDMAVLKKPTQGEVTNALPNEPLIPMSFLLDLTRPGKFKVELKATDELAKKTVTQTFDLIVEPGK